MRVQDTLKAGVSRPPFLINDRRSDAGRGDDFLSVEMMPRGVVSPEFDEW